MPFGTRTGIFRESERPTSFLGSRAIAPVSAGGTVRFQISNTLAVIAAALAVGVAPGAIFASLEKFSPIEHNAGRANLYKIRDSYVMVDYGHNPDAFVAMGEMLAHYPDRRKTAILGLPGDRQTDALIESGENAARVFDTLFLRDDEDRRGREIGEVPELLERWIAARHPRTEMCVMLDEAAAIETALERAVPGEIVVIFYDVLETALRSLRKFDPEPVSEIPRAPEPDLDNELGQSAALPATMRMT